LEGDVIVYLMPQFGISIGSGYICGKKGKDTNTMTITWPAATTTHTHDTKISAFPVKIGLNYFFPISLKARIVLNGGAGYYFAKLTEIHRWEENGYWNTFKQEAKASGLGFHGGIGFEYDLAQNIAFVIEGQGRHAKIGGFEGDWEGEDSTGWSLSRKGPLTYYEWQLLGNWYPEVWVRDEGPSGSVFRGAREAEVDFSGFTVRAGIKLKF